MKLLWQAKLIDKSHISDQKFKSMLIFVVLANRLAQPVVYRNGIKSQIAFKGVTSLKGICETSFLFIP